METPPPPVQMIQMLAGFQVSQAIYVAAKLGVADELVAGPKPVGAIADAIGADPVALGRLLRTLASMGVFTEVTPGVYGSTPLAATLVANVPGSMRDLALMWMETHYAPFGELVETVRTGECAATRYYGMPFFGWLAGHPDQIRRFSAAMANVTDGIKLGAVAALDLADARRVVDVGGADGTLLAHVLARNPGATGVAYDLPHVVAAARPGGTGPDVGERLSLEGGDFFESVPGGADAYLMSMILHDWDDERATAILTNIRLAAPAGARVLSFELVVPPGDTPHMAKMIDLTMLGMLTGRERTEAELEKLFGNAGLRYVGTTPTETPMSIAEAVVVG